VYDRDGNYLRSIGDKDTFDRPSGVDVSPDGSRLFVVDTGGVRSQNHGIKVFDAASGELLNTIGTRGTKEGEFNLPRDVKLGGDGLLYITDGGNFRIQVLTQQGEFVRSWGKPGARFGQFSRPKGISIDKDGNVYAVDAAFGNFQIFNADGQLLLFIGSRSTTAGPSKYMLPAGIDVDEDGRVYMVDQFFRKIEVYRPAGLSQGEGFLGIREER
jgi:DNA-binding beta-propeller fold protein YncE